MNKTDDVQQINAKLLKIFERIDGCKLFLERIKNALRKWMKTPPCEPFATIAHNDVWVNNIMIKLENDKPTQNKLLDFQVCDYGSPARDLLFFLFTSVKSYILEKRYDDFIELYRKTFTSILHELKCDSTLFFFEAFEKELEYEGKGSQFAHAVFMNFPIFAPKERYYEYVMG
ncbi:EcKinase, DUF1679, and/or APH domain containing protein [Asbolus verrucosus]|uniref:EcKinase, DUF1679, and/or APH domain containing protein n=1 Tax=Asbolus verrucosus TaxID=1661398 RepID=A0A482W2E2_ASBVE|nr:EcKinase, DUF1679, and/or APH domain containing protein [Asbolus verrucosus]